MLGALVLAVTVGCLKRREGDTSAEVAGCTECHGGLLEAPCAAAPPRSLAGEDEVEERGVGAHEAHLLGSDWARSVACEECHLVPETKWEEGHMDSEYPAEVVFSGPAEAFEAEPDFDHQTGKCEDTFCHGGYFVGGRPSGGEATVPIWTNTSRRLTSCTGCHGMPPPRPHPETSDCHDCHRNVREDDTFSHPELHVDGVVNFYLPND